MREHLRGDSSQVGKIASFREKGKAVWSPTSQQGAAGVGDVAGIGDEDHIAGVQDRLGEMEDAFLGPQERDDFIFRVKLDAMYPLIHPGPGLAQCRRTFMVLVTMTVRRSGRLGQRRDDVRSGRQVR